MTNRLRLTRTAMRNLQVDLPEAVAAAAVELIYRDLRANPLRVGGPLEGKFAGLYSAHRGTYRIVYSVTEVPHTDDYLITIVFVKHRGKSYH